MSRPLIKPCLPPVTSPGRKSRGYFRTRDRAVRGVISMGVTSNTFDQIVRIGHQGTAGGLITATTFTIATHGQTLDASTFTMVGIRAQSVGLGPNGGGGSAKDTSSTRTLIAAVPEPSSTLLLALALGSMCA